MRELRDALRRYFREHPDAADTPPGIAQRWLPADLRDVSIEQLRLTLGDMVASHEARCTILPDGSELYAGVAESPDSAQHELDDD